jgi:hypothetical protein
MIPGKKSDAKEVQRRPCRNDPSTDFIIFDFWLMSKSKSEKTAGKNADGR